MYTKSLIFILITHLSYVLLSPLCPCEDISLCNTIKRNGSEVYAFVLKSNRNVWSLFDWSKLTTVALVGFYDPELMCFAHQNNVRVVSVADYPKDGLNDDQQIAQWISAQIQYTNDRFLDGINIDIEYDINSDLAPALTSFTKRVSDAFHALIPGSQVTFDVPWAPYNSKGKGVDGRNYDFIGLANVTDFLFVMSYDEQSQIFGDECTARANSGLFATTGGLMAYLQQGIDTSKLVLGLPWYGYDYNCTAMGPETKCYIKKVPFRGVDCSDAAGRQLDYSVINNLVGQYGSHWDQHSQSEFVLYNDTNQVQHQIWFDDSYSLYRKISFALYKNLRGVGMWNANTLDYSGSTASKAMIADMWGTFPGYKSGLDSINDYKMNRKNRFSKY